MGPNGNVGIVAGALLGVINAAEALVKEIIEALMDVVSLAHNNSVALDGRVPDCSNGVYLGKEKVNILSMVVLHI